MTSGGENGTEVVAAVVMAGAVASGGAVIVASSVVVELTNSTKLPSLEVPVEKISSTPEAASNSLIEAEVGERGGGNDRRQIWDVREIRQIRQIREHVALQVKLQKVTKECHCHVKMYLCTSVIGSCSPLDEGRSIISWFMSKMCCQITRQE